MVLLLIQIYRTVREYFMDYLKLLNTDEINPSICVQILN